ncbi:Major facilitator sugar transporter-like [Trinorchestia longiramus]|nr:Major facilitator sugar transporter-like [Trinorchestia longiramus]
MGKHRFSTISQDATGGRGRASLDALFEYAGVVHPNVATHLLATLGVLLLSIGAVNVGPLFPVPLYSCWGGLSPNDVPRISSCSSRRLLPSVVPGNDYHVWECGVGSSWWSPVAAGLLVTARALTTVAGGLCMDVHGRRKVAVIVMGVYFVFAFSRSFAPAVEVSIVAIVVEGAAAQAATLALMLIAFENSTQKECVRSVCLILLGHSLGVGGVSSTIDTLLVNPMWQQLAKSIPSTAFIVLLFWMPESVRWVITTSRWDDACTLMPRTHNVAMDDVMRPKLRVIKGDMERCLMSVGCGQSALSRSVLPLVRNIRLLRVMLVSALCALVYGITIGTRIIVEPSPYVSLADRCVAYGAVELVVLVTIALMLGRVNARPMLCLTMLVLAATIALTTLTQATKVETCVGDVVLSLLGHGGAVAAGVVLVLSMWRLTPTHSRGAVCGLTWTWAVLGFAAAGPFCDLVDSFDLHALEMSAKPLACSVCCLLGAMAALLLPPTPVVLPDTLSHLTVLGNELFPEDDRSYVGIELTSMDQPRL